MTTVMRALWAAVAATAVLAGARVAQAACAEVHVESFADGLTIQLPARAHLQRTKCNCMLDYDDLMYEVVSDRTPLLTIDLTQHMNLQRAGVTDSRAIDINGMRATEYRRDGVVDSFRLELPCGGFRYALLFPDARDAKTRDAAITAVTSIRCVASPRPSST